MYILYIYKYILLYPVCISAYICTHTNAHAQTHGRTHIHTHTNTVELCYQQGAAVLSKPTLAFHWTTTCDLSHNHRSSLAWCKRKFPKATGKRLLQLWFVVWLPPRSFWVREDLFYPGWQIIFTTSLSVVCSRKSRPRWLRFGSSSQKLLVGMVTF